MNAARMSMMLALAVLACAPEAPTEIETTTAPELHRAALKVQGFEPKQLGPKGSVRWAVILEQLPKDNVFRLVFREKQAAPDGKKPAFTAEESARLARYQTDMDQAFDLYLEMKKRKQTGQQEVLALTALHARYALDRQQLYDALTRSPDVSPSARAWLKDAVAVASEGQRLQVKP